MSILFEYNNFEISEDGIDSIPDINKIEKRQLIEGFALSHFDALIGPKIHLSKSISSELGHYLENLMDFSRLDEKIFIFGFDEEISINFKFEIPSDWARGSVESLMVSFIVKGKYFDKDNKKQIEKFIEYVTNSIKSDAEIYKAFYCDRVPKKREISELEIDFIYEKAEKLNYLFEAMAKYFSSFRVDFN